jgi:cell division protease FtsH
MPGLDPVHKISIVQRGFGALGYTMQLPLEDRYLMTPGDLLGQLAVPRRTDGGGARAR